MIDNIKTSAHQFWGWCCKKWIQCSQSYWFLSIASIVIITSILQFLFFSHRINPGWHIARLANIIFLEPKSISLWFTNNQANTGAYTDVITSLLYTASILLAFALGGLTLWNSLVLTLRKLIARLPASDPNVTPDKLTENSIVNREEEITTIINRIISNDHYVLSIEGIWGEGKSYMAKEIIKKLKDNHTCIWTLNFNPWNIDSKQSVIKGFFNELGNSYSELKSIAQRLSKSLVGSDFSFGGFTIHFGTKDESIENLKNELVWLLKKYKTKLVIFIDDIDRLPKKKIPIVFQLIAEFSDLDKENRIKFVLCFDRNELEKSLKQLHYPTKYLEKFVELSFVLFSSNNNLSSYFERQVGKECKKMNLSDFQKHEILESYKRFVKEAPFNILQDHSTREANKNHYILRTIRSVDRFIEELFLVPIEKYGFCNIQILFDLLLIKTFAPSLYTYIYQHKDIFQNNMIGKKDPLLIETLQELGTAFYKDITNFRKIYDNAVLKTAFKLFPRFEKLFKLAPLSDEERTKDDQAYETPTVLLNIAESEHFPKYFSSASTHSIQVNMTKIRVKFETLISSTNPIIKSDLKTIRTLGTPLKNTYGLSAIFVNIITSLLFVHRKSQRNIHSLQKRTEDFLICWMRSASTHMDEDVVNQTIKALYPIKDNNSLENRLNRNKTTILINKFYSKALKTSIELPLLIYQIQNFSEHHRQNERMLFQPVINLLKSKIVKTYGSLEQYCQYLHQKNFASTIFDLVEIIAYLNDPKDFKFLQYITNDENIKKLYKRENARQITPYFPIKATNIDGNKATIINVDDDIVLKPGDLLETQDNGPEKEVISRILKITSVDKSVPNQINLTLTDP